MLAMGSYILLFDTDENLGAKLRNNNCCEDTVDGMKWSIFYVLQKTQYLEN